jgi:hypothetical protein
LTKIVGLLGRQRARYMTLESISQAMIPSSACQPWR